MKSRISLAIGLSAISLLAACATPEGYPDLGLREAERVTGTLSVPETPPFTPAPAAPATLAQLDELVESARSAHADFLSAAGEARGPVNAARGAAIGSEEWSVAQVAVADLESLRSQAMIALADIDRIYLSAATQGGEIARIESARAEVAGLVDEENRLVEALLAAFDS